MRLTGLILMVLLAFTFSCAPMIIEGRKIDSTKLEQLIMGQTQVAKVEELFGKPDKVEKLPSGEENFLYFYKRENPHWWTVDKIDKQKLEIVIKEGVVQTYKFREEGKEAVLKQ
jgi:hypothetical protein